MKPPVKSPAELLAPGRTLTLANVAEGAEGLVISDLARAIAARLSRPAIGLPAISLPAISLAVVCRAGAVGCARPRRADEFHRRLAGAQWLCQVLHGARARRIRRARRYPRPVSGRARSTREV